MWAWVVAEGQKLIEISPGFDPVNRRNGSIINPHATSQVEQAYDDRIGDFTSELLVALPHTLRAGESIISTSSRGDDPEADLWGVRSSHPKLREASVLTVLSEVPPENSFRPPYAGTDKPLYNLASIDWSKLPRHSVESFNADPAYDFDDVGAVRVGRDSAQSIVKQYETYFERVWLMHLSDWRSRLSHPVRNMPNYHASIYGLIGETALLLSFDIPNIDKLAIHMIQLGIDSYYVMKSGPAGGSGLHKLPILIAGLLLQAPELSDLDGIDQKRFRSDWMTYYVNLDTQTSEESALVPENQVYTGFFDPSMPGVPAWRQDPGREFEHLYPDPEWEEPADHCRANTYRGINSRALQPAVVAAVALGLKKKWGHPALFDYIFRWMTESISAEIAEDVLSVCETDTLVEGNIVGEELSGKGSFELKAYRHFVLEN